MKQRLTLLHVLFPQKKVSFKREKKVCRPPGVLAGGCPDPGLNRGPLDLQSNALPTELSRPTVMIDE